MLNSINTVLTEKYWAIEADFLEILLGQLQEQNLITSVDNERASSMLSFLSSNSNYEIVDNVGIVDINGPLVKRAGLFATLLGIGSYEAIGDNFKKAMEDPKVKAVMLKIDSPGGVLSGVATLSNTIYGARNSKPVMAFVDGNMSSAALWLGSSASQIILSDSTSRAGSLGVIALHREVSKLAEKVGITFTIFSSGSFKASGNEFEALNKKDKEYIQSMIDFYHQEFLKTISRNLNISVTQIPEGVKQSRVFIGSEAIQAGLASEILSFDDALNKLRSMAGTRSNTSFPKSKSSANAATKGDLMKFKDYGIKEIIMEIQAVEDIDKLATLEQNLIYEADRRMKGAENWHEKAEAKSLKNDIISLVSQQRRMILTQPGIEKSQREFELGKSIARAAFPTRCKI